MLYYTLQIDTAEFEEVDPVICGVFDSKESLMDFIKNNIGHLDGWIICDSCLSYHSCDCKDCYKYNQYIYYIITCCELNKSVDTNDESIQYQIFRKDI